MNVLLSRWAVLIFFTVFLAVLIATAPASLFSPVVRALSDGRVELANCHGTVWQGGGTPVFLLRDGTSMPFPAMHWQVQYAPLLSGILQANVGWYEMSDAAPMELSVQGKQLMIKNALILVPARLIGEASDFLKPVQFNGILKLQSDRMDLSGRQLNGKATIHWMQAGSALSAINPLGDYRIDLDAKQNSVAIGLATLSGALRLDGRGSWSVAQGLHFNGHASAGSEQDGRLAELLYHIGPEISPGRHAISISEAR